MTSANSGTLGPGGPGGEIEQPLPEPVPSSFTPLRQMRRRYFDIRSYREKLAVIKRLYRERFGCEVGEKPIARLGGS